MPAAPKSPPSRRSTPKAKGAIRAKSGCYTCRIRRKKCDEQQSTDTGSCQTCIRLKLECLGFGAKRPEWLREARNVTEVREKIKNFLASQGMIKGHSGTAPSRSAEPDLSQLGLRLAVEREDSYSDSSSGSPPTPTLSLSHESSYRHHTSNMRDEPLWSGHSSAYQSGLYSSGLQRDHSPYSQDSNDQFNYQPSDNTLVPAFSYAMRSGLSPLYHWNPTADDTAESFPQTPVYLFNQQPQTMFPPGFLNDLAEDYMREVVHAQYLLVGIDVPNMIYETVNRHLYARRAVEVLASVYYRRFQQPRMQAIGDSELTSRLEPLQPLLNNPNLSGEDAMAALHVVSSFLFDGGQGQWRQWLQAACRYVRGLLRASRWRSSYEVLCYSTPQDAFIIKTTIWFDVLASITTGDDPYFLYEIREMFDPNVSRVLDPAHESKFSMLSPMGCENRVVWALAETSHLAVFKRVCEEEGNLSVAALVRHANEIDIHLDPPLYSMNLSGTLMGRCQLASEVFRSSTRLYLRSVVSGDHPQVPEIAQSVQDVIQSINRATSAPDSGDHPNPASRSITRNTVFGFYIAGALANPNDGREVIRKQLSHEGQGSGNCGSILHMLESLWEQRNQSPPNAPVPWRAELRRTSTLLV